MSSNLLQQAVQLAQAGQKSEARQLILQFLQTEPSNETAWLWLASVAGDQTEYQRALNEVLRLNPNNQRAQQLLAEFEQQYGGAARYAPPQQQVSPQLPQVSPYAPPQQPITPPPQVSPYAAMQQPISGAPSGVPYSPPAPVEVKVKTIEKRRGCLGCSLPGCGCLGCGGCGQGCLLAFLILVILPAVVCGGLSLSPISLGPLDLPASYLPGEMGRKEIKLTTDTYNITLKAGRSWYLVTTNDQMWTFWSNALEGTVPFDKSTEKWSDLESHPGVDALIVDIDMIALSEGRDVIKMELYPDTVSEDFSCTAVRAKFAGGTKDYQQVFDYGGGLCGYRENDNLMAGPTTPVFKTMDPPGQERTITFYTPVSSSTALKWQISIPDAVYTKMGTADDIEKLIDSVDIKTR